MYKYIYNIYTSNTIIGRYLCDYVYMCDYVLSLYLDMRDLFEYVCIGLYLLAHDSLIARGNMCTCICVNMSVPVRIIC